MNKLTHTLLAIIALSATAIATTTVIDSRPFAADSSPVNCRLVADIAAHEYQAKRIDASSIEKAAYEKIRVSSPKLEVAVADAVGMEDASSDPRMSAWFACRKLQK